MERVKNEKIEIENDGDEQRRQQRRVALLYDERMCKHFSPDDDDHPEQPDRIRSIWNKLQSSGLTQRCVILKGKEAEDKHINAVHDRNHVAWVKSISSKQYDSQRNRIATKFNSIYLNEGTSEAAYLAAGSVVEVTERVAKGEFDSAFAIVRPPGHHAEENEPMGFCLFNNVGIATNYLLDERSDLGIKKILVVDWDVHHGNGTQKMFWKDPRVLFFSVHRYEFGSFYPATDDGSHTMIGEGPGRGYNINVPWDNGRCGDADYLAVWDHVLIPVAKDFNPDIIIVSAGFDAALRDPLGGCCVTPYGYSLMLKKLMEFAQGKIVMALEGGYNLNSIAKSVNACVEVLLGDMPISRSLNVYPFESTWRVIQAVRQELHAFWPTLGDELPKNLPSRKVPVVKYPLSSSSDSDGENYEEIYVVSETADGSVQKMTETLSNLRVDGNSIEQVSTTCSSWRSEHSKIDVWYATYGSNMWKPRFLCYIEGGEVEGMRRSCVGSMDKNPPKEILWKTFPHRLFFGWDYTPTWGPGGAAFLHPESTADDKAHLCLYRITLEQFNDVLLQENILSYDEKSPLFDISALNSLPSQHSVNLEVLKNCWYHTVVHLGKENDIPVLTMTCSFEDVESFKSGKFKLCPPAQGYSRALVKGLVEGKQLEEEAAMAYIQEAASKAL
ncbi:Histone deacetylase domain [Dillenia turbinata]|uniref:histone deacetylase n=1 Tax=Dillenia turbinata TaxID=194707 RepID=A0AAN8UXF9_9MAGN